MLQNRPLSSGRLLDELRAQYPTFGFALYAYEPGGPVTLEVHSDGQVFAFTAPTEAEVLERAFPSPPEPDPQPTNIFD